MRTVLTLLSLPLVNSLYCFDEQNKEVDLWLSLKGPKGTQYVYWDLNKENFERSEYNLNDTSFGALAFTLQQLWNIEDLQYIFWNDEPAPNPLLPTGQPYSFTVGHSKGVWVWDMNTNNAIILKHSIPLFPQGPGMVDSYTGMGENAWEYGQHVSCFSTTLDNLLRIAKPLQLVRINIYDFRIDSTTPQPIQDLANGDYLTEAVCFSGDIKTQENRTITFFTKSSQWDNELYSECIAPKMQSNLLVESWLRGEEEGAYCNGTYQVLDVQLLDYNSPGMYFSERDDHSKWVVGNSFFCVSDINRMTTQYVRGGTAFCWEDSYLVKMMKQVIVETDSC